MPDDHTCFVNPLSYQKDYTEICCYKSVNKTNFITIKWKQRIILLEEEDLFLRDNKEA